MSSNLFAMAALFDGLLSRAQPLKRVWPQLPPRFATPDFADQREVHAVQRGHICASADGVSDLSRLLHRQLRVWAFGLGAGCGFAHAHGLRCVDFAGHLGFVGKGQVRWVQAVHALACDRQKRFVGDGAVCEFVHQSAPAFVVDLGVPG